jgi:very-short-patch-repair endonuclease
MTDAERTLWSKLRMKQIDGYQFYRQKIIGNYTVDFFCHRASLVIEVDGGQHYFEPQVELDSKRDEYIRNLGIRILRFNDVEVLTNIAGVIETLINEIGNEKPLKSHFTKRI